MAISGTYFIKKWIPNANLVHGEGFQPTPPDGAGPGGPPPGAPAPSGEGVPPVELPDYGEPCENFFEGEMTFEFEPQADGSLKGTAGGAPIISGYYTGDEFFKVEYNAGPGRWEIWARVDKEGNVTGMVSVGEGKGFPNFAYGKKIK